MREFRKSLLLSPFSVANERTEWSKKMQEFSQLLPRLLVQVSKSKSVFDKSTREQIKKDTKRLSELSHKLETSLKNKKSSAISSDPTLKLLSEGMQSDAKRAYQALQEGHWEYGRQLILGTSSRCIACHTRLASGPDFPKLNFNVNIKGLDRMQKAQLLAATRQFDKAVDAFEKIVLDQSILKQRQIEWNKALSYTLAILVRFKRDPERAYKILKTVSAFKGLPSFLKADLGAWNRSLSKWKSEKVKPKSLDEKSLYLKAKGLVEKAQTLQKYPTDQAGDVTYLRATAVLHDLLGRYPKGRYTSEALLLAGMSYEVLNYPGLWGLQDSYYDMCIREKPHSKVAAQCYEMYEESVYFGFSGSGGTSIPRDVRTRMNELRTLSQSKS